MLYNIHQIYQENVIFKERKLEIWGYGKTFPNMTNHFPNLLGLLTLNFYSQINTPVDKYHYKGVYIKSISKF